MQEKKNKRLLVVLLALIVITGIVYFNDGSTDHMDVDRSLFSYNDPAAIDKVIFTFPDSQLTLHYDNKWLVNEKYEADPQRIKVLFAVLKQVKVRRPVSKQKVDSISNQFEKVGTQIDFYESDKIVDQFKVLGNDRTGLSYMQRIGEQEAYIVEIPGYRSYLAGIFAVDANGWRDPLVFDINWSNLQSVSVTYPGKPENSFDVVFEDGAYKVSQLQKTDTTLLYNLLDNVSRLYVNDYLYNSEVRTFKEALAETTASIVVTDVGKNAYTLEVYGEVEDKNAFLVRIDSADFGLLARNKLRQVLKPRKLLAAGKK